MAGFPHLPQQMEYGLTNAGFLFCHGHGAAASANTEDATSLENSSVVLDSPPGRTASVEKKRKPREDSASLNSAHSSKDSKENTTKRGGKKQNKEMEEEEEPKGYIHVRARRGQATDSHSLSERVRRERISERMRMLQALVPGCDKVTGKALILDEIINYVQSLQNQVEFLSMRIASLSPMLYGFGMDSDAAFSDHSQKIEGMFQEAVAMPTSAMNRSASPALSQAIMDTSTSSSPPYSLQGQGDLSLSQDNGSSSYMMQTVGEPRQELFNQVVFSNYMCSFQ